MTKHSDKGLETLTLMGTKPEQWKLTGLRWVREQRKVKVQVTCPTCGGDRFVARDEKGEIIPRPTGAGYRELAKHHDILKAQNPRMGTWDTGNCPTCIRKRKPYDYRTGRAYETRMVEVEVGYPIWPEGVRFDSRFGGGCICGLCGKTILKSNLVPVAAIGEDGKAHGMAVGSDCAKKFLAVKSPAKEGVKILEVEV